MPEYGELRLIISKNGMICGAEYPKVRHTYPLNLEAEAIQIPKDHGRLIDMDDSMIFHGFDEKYFEECKRKIFEFHGILEAEVWDEHDT